MAEINDKKGIKTIAFYLPQFHAIPENDKAWGEGFTEWTNTKKAVPMFDGHYQPKVPLNENYYNLLDDSIKLWQAKLAKEYDVFGFCYYHYWFKNGKKLLEKPLEQMLKNKKIDLPFCISWANENWSKRWDGGQHELIAEQHYGDETDWKQHLEYLLQFFNDERYITLNGKPVFIIYKPEEIPNVNNMLQFWNEEMKKKGRSEICFMIQNPAWYFSHSYDIGLFDYQIKFYPFWSICLKGKNMRRLRLLQKLYRGLKWFKIECIFDKLYNYLKKKKNSNSLNIQKKLDYDEMWELLLDSESKNNLIEGAFVDWDNSARKKNGYATVGATPENFKNYMMALAKKINKNNQEPVIFLNAWNEWCEGAYLEPDEKNGYQYLQAHKNALNSVKD